ncbi:hypothetical protein LUZ60_013342 [Juncus effusus]|nr:hypothetical protein LUZ60_013342 [Juncus effusus]
MATSNWAATMIQNWLRHNPKSKICDIIGKIRDDHGVEISYQKAWKAREIAMASIYGSHEEAYNLIPDYADALLASNPGSVIKLKRSIDNSFEHLFVCFNGCKGGFMSGCRPFLGVDGCHLADKYRGCLLTAIALGENSGLFPVAFAVVEIENGESWQWFFECLNEDIGDIPRLAILSDGQKGLEGALKRVFPWAEHRLCLQHLFKNYLKKNWGPELEGAFWNITKIFAPIPVERMLKELEQNKPDAYNWFLRNGEGKCWRRSLYNHEIKCNHFTNNCAESFNSKILDVRHPTVYNLVDGIRQKLMTDIFKRHKIGLTWTDPLVPRVMRHLKKEMETIRSYRVKKSLRLRAEVMHEERIWAVDIETRSCSCNDWQVSGVPCSHAISALYDFRLPIEDYVHDFYRVDMYRSCYSYPINPLPDKGSWLSLVPKTLNPPHERKAPGRPKKKCQRGTDEDRTGRTVQWVPLNRAILDTGRARGRGRGHDSMRGRARGQGYSEGRGASSEGPSTSSTQH